MNGPRAPVGWPVFVFEAGEAVPEWLLAADPYAPDSVPPRIVEFGAKTVVICAPDQTLIAPLEFSICPPVMVRDGVRVAVGSGSDVDVIFLRPTSRVTPLIPGKASA